MAINRSRRGVIKAGLAVVAAGAGGVRLANAQTRGAAAVATSARANGPLFFDVETTNGVVRWYSRYASPKTFGSTARSWNATCTTSPAISSGAARSMRFDRAAIAEEITAMENHSTPGCRVSE